MKQMHNFILFAIMLLIMCTACDRPKNTLALNTLTLNLQEGDPPSLNPYVGVDLRSRCLYLSLFEPLMRRNPEGKVEPAAAQSVEVDETKTVYTFHMRPHQWSNEEKVTAYHFEQAWKYALQPGSHCVRADLFYPIKNAEKVKKGELSEEHLGIHAPNADTLIVTLEQPTFYFLDLVATPFYSPLFSATPEEPTCFNGPFILKEHIPDQSLVLKRNPFYWDVEAVQLDEICFTMVKDPMTAYALYEKGELDLIGDPLSSLPFDLIPTLLASKQLKTKTISRIFYLLVNNDSYPMDVKPLRKALSLCIDREQLTKHLFLEQLSTSAPLPSNLSSLKQELSFDPQQSRLLFEQALTEMEVTREEFPKITLSYADLSGQKRLAEFLQEQWQEHLGIQVEIVCNEWNLHIAHLRKGTYQIGTLHLTTLYQDPMFYLDLFRDKNSLCNYCRWEDPAFRSLLERSEKLLDPQLRHHYLEQAEEMLQEEMPVISLFTQNLLYLLRDQVKLEITDLGIYDFKHCTVSQLKK